MKGGSKNSEILCVDQLARAEKIEQKIATFSEAPSWGKYRPTTSVKLYRQKIFTVSFKSNDSINIIIMESLYVHLKFDFKSFAMQM